MSYQAIIADPGLVARFVGEMTTSTQVDTHGRRARSTVELSWDLWKKLRAEPKVVAEPYRAPPPLSGDWLTELEITAWPAAPPGWTLQQRYQPQGPQVKGKPLQSLALIYRHDPTRRGTTVVLHLLHGVNKGSADAWRFDTGLIWHFCPGGDCTHERPSELLRSAGATEIKTLLTEGTT